MGLDDISKVAKSSSNAKLIITHLDAVPHAMIGRKEVKDYVKSHNLSGRVLVPDDGEVVSLV